MKLRKNIAALLLSLLMPVLVWSAQVVRYVDPDAAGAGTGVDWTNAYTALKTCLDTEAVDLVSAGDYLTIYLRSSGGTADTTAVNFSSWTGTWTDATHYIEIIQTDFPSDGVFDATKYVLASTNASAIQFNTVGYVHLHNVQIQITATTGTVYGVLFPNSVAPTSVVQTLDSCIVKGVCSGTGICYGIYHVDNFTTVNIYNTLIYGFVSGADINFEGIRNAGDGSMYVYNSTIYGNRTGIINVNPADTHVFNCAVGNNTDDFWLFSGTLEIDHCCSDDGDGTNAQAPAGGDWATVFTTPGSDFSLLVGGACVGTGTDNPGAGLYSDDIIGTARSSTWDIGAFEYAVPVAGGGEASNGVIIIE